MPPKGFKTITIEESTYDVWHVWYEKRKHALAARGYSSFSGAISGIMFYIINGDPKLITDILKIPEDQKDG